MLDEDNSLFSIVKLIMRGSQPRSTECITLLATLPKCRESVRPYIHVILIFNKPRGKECTEVQISQNKGKESENS